MTNHEMRGTYNKGVPVRLSALVAHRALRLGLQAIIRNDYFAVFHKFSNEVMATVNVLCTCVIFGII